MESLKKEIGLRLKQARIAKKLTLLATCVYIPGLSTTRLSNWENGSRLADLSIVKKLAKIYGTSPGYLLTLDDTPPNPEIKLLIDLYRAADRRGQATILRVAETEATYDLKILNLDTQRTE